MGYRYVSIVVDKFKKFPRKVPFQKKGTINRDSFEKHSPFMKTEAEKKSKLLISKNLGRNLSLQFSD